MYIRCIHGIVGRENTKYAVRYCLYIRFWPTLHIARKSRLARSVCIVWYGTREVRYKRAGWPEACLSCEMVHILGRHPHVNLHRNALRMWLCLLLFLAMPKWVWPALCTHCTHNPPHVPSIEHLLSLDTCWVWMHPFWCTIGLHKGMQFRVAALRPMRTR